MKALVQYLRTPRRVAWLALPALFLLMATEGTHQVPRAAALQVGTVNIQKEIVNAAGQPVTGANLAGFVFALTSAAGATFPMPATTATGTTSLGVAGGTYTITEQPMPGITPAGFFVCTTATPPVCTPVANFTVTPGTPVTIVARNQIPGTGTVAGAITITKQVVDAAGTPLNPQPTDRSGFSFTVTGPNNFSTTVVTAANGGATLNNLALGTYTVSEGTRAGFAPAGMTVDTAVFPAGTDASFALTAADPAANVTASNRAVTTGTVTVTKQVVDANGSPVAGADLSGFQFTLACGTATGQAQTAATGTATFTNVAAGTCTITETTRSGFTIVSITPTGGQNILVQGTTGGTFAVGAGQAVALTVVNRQLPAGGTVTVTKQMVDANGAVIANADVSGFQFTITCGTGAGAFTQAQTTTGATALTFTNVPAGTCTVTETARSGFGLVSITPAGGQNIVATGQLGGNFSVTAGQTAALTVQNRVAAAPTQVINLFPGCNNQTSTWPTGTRTEVVASGVAPAAILIAIWRHDAAANRFFGFSTIAGAPNDLLTVDFLQPLFFCVREAGTLTRPVVE